MKINRKHLKFVSLSWLASFILALLIYVSVISPQQETKKQILVQLAEKEKVYTEILRLNQKEAQNNLNNQISQWHARIAEFAITSEDLAGLTFDISRIAGDLKLDSFTISAMDAFTAKSASTENFVTQKQLKVDFKADFKKFAIFLNSLERHRPAIFIDRFEINNTEHNPKSSQVSMVLSIFVKKKQGS